MSVRQLVSNAALAISGFIGSKTAALAAANPEEYDYSTGWD